jgi:hypothetical protein
MLVGPRRIGKTTVCEAVCERLRTRGMSLVQVEVPERADSTALLQLIVDRCNRLSVAAGGRRLLRSARPLAERLLADRGIPLDLSELGAEPGALPTRAILALPRSIAEQTGRSLVLFLDELQRAVGYADGEQVLQDLVDLYGGSTDVVVLVDGSDERVLDGMLGAPVHFGKLCDRLSLSARIVPVSTWRAPLSARFAQAGMQIDEAALDALLDFGDGRPYETMTAARYAALSARKVADGDAPVAVAAFDVQMGIDEAERHLADDGG